LPRRLRRIRSVTVVRGERLAWLDFTNRPVTVDRARVTKFRLGCRRAMASGYPRTVAYNGVPITGSGRLERVWMGGARIHDRCGRSEHRRAEPRAIRAVAVLLPAGYAR
jgi:hypothetical protein